MKTFMLLVMLVLLGGCAHWNKLSEGEKVGVVVGTTIIVGAMIIRNGQDDTVNKVCISTRSIQTGCGGAQL